MIKINRHLKSTFLLSVIIWCAYTFSKFVLMPFLYYMSNYPTDVKLLTIFPVLFFGGCLSMALVLGVLAKKLLPVDGD